MIFGLRHWNNNGWMLYICGVLGLGATLRYWNGLRGKKRSTEERPELQRRILPRGVLHKIQGEC